MPATQAELPETLCDAGVDALGQHGDTQSARADATQEAAQTTARVEDLRHHWKRAAAEAEHDDVTACGNRGQPLFQRAHGARQPLRENSDERAHEQHIAAHGQSGGDHAPPAARVITQIAGIGQAQKGPPHRLAEPLFPRWQDEQSTDQRHNADRSGHDQQLVTGALDELALEEVAQPVGCPQAVHRRDS